MTSASTIIAHSNANAGNVGTAPDGATVARAIAGAVRDDPSRIDAFAKFGLPRGLLEEIAAQPPEVRQVDATQALSPFSDEAVLIWTRGIDGSIAFALIDPSPPDGAA